MKNNCIPKGLVLLEKLFENNDVAKNHGVKPSHEDVEDINVGIEHEPRLVNISTKLSAEEKEKYLNFLKQHSDVFAWSYDDLKVYVTSVIKHTIPLKENENHFKKKIRRVSPLLLPLIEKEIGKLFDAKIIICLRHSKWLANIVPIRKKNGEIRLCIESRNLNRVPLKDNYPLPKMDHLLQKVVGAHRISTLDGIPGYNQILIHPNDQEKTTFTTPWGTFMYVKMPFGLMNVGATFQRAMDITFSEEKDNFLVICLDDIMVFSRSDEDHIRHLEQVFQKCKENGVSLNPKKSNFALEEGKLSWAYYFQRGY